jgi:dTDP-glucose 4,6-dehydratase
LNAARVFLKDKDFLFLQVSTDEVYGTLPENMPEMKFHETTPLDPHSPYSASKTGADLLAKSYFDTFGFPVRITRCSNNYGPFQFPEKLIPLMIHNAMNDKNLPVYGDGKNVRDWLYVEDHCDAIWQVINKGKNGEVYNIGGNNEMQNIEIVKLILKHLGKPESLITYVKDRLGHDRRYAIDASKIAEETGWKPKHNFEEKLAETIDWYKSNQDWTGRIKSGEYRKKGMH